MYVDVELYILNISCSADLVSHHRDAKKRTPRQKMRRKRKADYLLPLLSLLPQPLQIPASNNSSFSGSMEMDPMYQLVATYFIFPMD